MPNVSPIGFWEVAVDAVAIDGAPLQQLATGRTAILDTGTSESICHLCRRRKKFVHPAKSLVLCVQRIRPTLLQLLH